MHFAIRHIVWYKVDERPNHLRRRILRNKKRLIILAALIAAAALAAAGLLIFRNRDDNPSRYVWSVQTGTGAENLLVRGDRLDRIKGDLPALIEALNRSVKTSEAARLPRDGGRPVLPEMRYKGLNEGILDLEVQNDEYLTERMGSTGAEEYLAAATFTLTEYKGIKSVRFLFEEGDHAVPGIYSRESFLKRWKVVSE